MPRIDDRHVKKIGVLVENVAHMDADSIIRSMAVGTAKKLQRTVRLVQE